MSNPTSRQVYYRQPVESPQDFRQRCFQLFDKDFHAEFNEVLNSIKGEPFRFAGISNAHNIQVRNELLARHSMPYWATWMTVAADRRPETGALKVCLLVHTLALLQLDYHLDGASPDVDNPATGVKMSSETAAAYAVRLAYRGSHHAAKLPYGDRILSEVIEPYSGFVIERMHQDWNERFRPFSTNTAPSLIKDYLESSNSRLYGSGYWEVMIRSAWIAAFPESKVPDSLITFSKHVRRLRQLVDEMDDISEDLASGLLTLPILLSIQHDHNFGRTLSDNWDPVNVKRIELTIVPIVKSTMSELIIKEVEAARKVAVQLNSPYLDALVSVKQAKAEIVLGSMSGADMSAN